MKKIMGVLLLFGLIATHESEGQSKTQVSNWSYYQSIIDYNLFRPLSWRPRGQVELSSCNFSFFKMRRPSFTTSSPCEFQLNGHLNLLMA